MKLNIAPRFKVKITKEVRYKGGALTPGEIIGGLKLHNKPLDGLRYYQDKGSDNYILIPLDCFKLLERT